MEDERRKGNGTIGKVHNVLPEHDIGIGIVVRFGKRVIRGGTRIDEHGDGNKAGVSPRKEGISFTIVCDKDIPIARYALTKTSKKSIRIKQTSTLFFYLSRS